MPAGAARTRGGARGGEQLGLLAARLARLGGLLELVDGVVSSAAAGAAKPAPAVFERALELAGVAAADALHVGDSLDNDVAGARAAGIRPLLSCADGRPPVGVEAIRDARSRPPTLIGVEERRLTPAADPPELPQDSRPRWPLVRRPLGFVVARLWGSSRPGWPGRCWAWTTRASPRARSSWGRSCSTASLVAVALLFASFVRQPRAWHFGLRRTRFWPAVGWAALGIFAFYVFAAVYTVAVQPDVEQTVAEDLGADESTFGLIAAGFMIVCVAPFAEEFFFRGFFYGALSPLLGRRGGAHRRGCCSGSSTSRAVRRPADRPAAGGAGGDLLPRLRADAARSIR